MSSSHPATDTLHILLYIALPARIRNILYRPIDNNLPNPNVHILRTHISHSAAISPPHPSRSYQTLLMGTLSYCGNPFTAHIKTSQIPIRINKYGIIPLMQVNITPNTKDFHRKVLQFPKNFIPLHTQSRNAQIINIAEWSSW